MMQLRSLESLWASIAARGQQWVRLPKAEAPLEVARQLAVALLSERGEASGAALSRELLAAYLRLDRSERRAFHHFLASNFVPPADRLREAAEAYLKEPGTLTASRLTQAAEPPRQELLRRLNSAPGATAALVALRHEVLEDLADDPDLKPLDTDLRHLLNSWFNRGFLELRRIDWHTPAVVLEKLIAYEAVHEIAGWSDLRRRLAPDRRCFAFFHPALPDEPLIFVEVALVSGMASAIGPLLAPPSDTPPTNVDTAIFYSINNCQQGLRGISFGNMLIKQVVEELRQERPNLRCFATLSPVPGFRQWLDARIEAEAMTREQAAQRPALAEFLRLDGDASLAQRLRTADWHADPETAAQLAVPLSRVCAEYLTVAEGTKGLRDPVARFHLGNGARLERVDWLGNPSSRGLAESYGLMVNYLYDPEQIEANHEAFVHGVRVARSGEIEALLQGKTKPRLARRRLVSMPTLSRGAAAKTEAAAR
jgi:malonyl-CoA decarboxylase